MYFLLEKDGLVIPYFVALVSIVSFGIYPYLFKKSPITSDVRVPGLLADGTPSFLMQICVQVYK